MKKININGINLVLTGTILTMLLAGCNNVNSTSSNIDNSSTYEDINDQIEEPISYTLNYDGYVKPMYDICDKQEYEFISLSDTGLALYNNKIDSVEINFIYDDIYYDINSNNTIDNLNKTTVAYSKEYYEITSDKIYEIVRKNSTNLGSITEEQLKRYSTYIAEVINEYIDSPYINKDCLYKKIDTLKIEEKSIIAYAATLPDNTLIITKYINSETIELQEHYVKHEAFHLLQNASPEYYQNNPNVKTAMGFNQELNDWSINSRFNIWYSDACAEKIASISSETEPNTYYNELGYLDMINIIYMLDPEYEANGLEKLSLSEDINDLYKVFDANTKEEQVNVIKLMSACGFVLKYKLESREKYEELYGQFDEAKLTKEVKIDVFNYLSKVFYQKLALKINEEGMSLDDAFALITLFEGRTSDHLFLNQSDTLELAKDYLDNYQMLQDSFFEVIASENNITKEELINKFKNYTMYYMENGEKTNNYQLEWVTKEDIDFKYYIDSMYYNSPALIYKKYK